VVLHSGQGLGITHALLELHLMQPAPNATKASHPPDVQQLLDEFIAVFQEPSGLPPSRQYDHHIPLIPGAWPVSMRPYRVAPKLKSEIEHQIQELLQQGVISHSCSPFCVTYSVGQKGGQNARCTNSSSLATCRGLPSPQCSHC
jgi:hypothetical protein